MKNVLMFFLVTSAIIGTGVLMQPEKQAGVQGTITYKEESLWVVNVDLLDSNGNWLRSTLSGKEGEYDFDSLSAGTYFIQVEHASYYRDKQKIVLKDGQNETVNFNLRPRLTEPEVVEVDEKVEEEGIIDGMEMDMPAPRMAEPGEKRFSRKEALMASRGGGEGGDMPGAGTLTAGEINDFSKWVLWEDLTETSFDQYQQQWGLFLKNRYSVQITFKNGNPVVDAEVQLQSDRGETVYIAKTDNTGKAELWADMVPQIKDRMARRYKAVVQYKDKSFRFPKLDAFPNGLNTLEIDMPCEVSDIMDIAFVVDATGSMGDEINYLKVELQDVIQRVKAANPKLQLRTGSVFYRDHKDQYLTRTSNFSTEIDSTLNFIRQQYAAGGGDFPEAVDEALDAALNRLSWSLEARGRLLFLVLDAPPHQADSVVKRVQQLVLKAAALGVRIIPVTGSGINKDVEFLMRSMALATNGTYTFLTDHSGVGNGHLAPSTDKYDVLKLNDLLVNLINRYATAVVCNETPTLETQDSVRVVEVPVDSNAQTFEILTLNCFPVPSTGPVSFKVSHPDGEIYILDMNGKMLLRFEMKERNVLKVDLSQLAAGIYFVRYDLKGKMVTQRIVLR